MNPEIRRMLERQAAWQKARAALPWEEKLRQSLIMRRAADALRKTPRTEKRAAGAQPTPAGERNAHRR